MPPNENSDIFAAPRAWSVTLAKPTEALAPEIIDEPGLFRRAIPSKSAVARPQAMPGTIDRFVVMVMSIDLLVTVLLQRIYVGVSVTLATHIFAVAILFYGKRLRLSGTRIVLYWLVWGGSLAVAVLSGNTFSKTSMLLGVVCYIPFLAVVPASQETYFEVIKTYQKIAMGVAIIVFLDLILQVAGLGMPNMNTIVPTGLTSPTMNYIQPMDWKASITKPNGFFMLEASYTSQFIAIGLVVELAFFRRWKWLLGFSLALLGTFSGTGLLLFLLSLPVLMRRFWRSLLIYGAILLPLLGGVAVATGWADLALKRAASFDQKGSSANERFVAPFTSIYDVMTSGDEHRIFYGLGAGKAAFDDAIPSVDNTIEYNVVSRVFLEYGLIILFLVLIFTSYILFSTGTPFIIAFVAAVEYHLMGGHYLLPPILNYCYILTAGWVIIHPVAVRRASVLEC